MRRIYINVNYTFFIFVLRKVCSIRNFEENKRFAEHSCNSIRKKPQVFYNPITQEITHSCVVFGHDEKYLLVI